jgi:hypothetical protein
MSDPNAQFTRGLQGQAPPAAGTDLDEWAKGDATRKWNLNALGQSGGGPSMGDGGQAQVFHYTTPPDPRTLNIGLFMVASFIVFCLSAPIFGTLYPAATAAALAAGLISDGLLRHTIPAWDASSRLAISLPAAITVFWIASRLDHRAAASLPAYRWARHVARVILVSLLVAASSLNPEGGLVPTNAYQLHAIVSNPAFLPFVGVMAVVTHITLTKAATLRGMWDRGLAVWRLRPSDLPRING